MDDVAATCVYDDQSVLIWWIGLSLPLSLSLSFNDFTNGEVYFSSFAFAAGAGGWVSFFALFAKSKFTHVVTLDFLVLTLLAPFWVFNDAEMRKWNRG